MNSLSFYLDILVLIFLAITIFYAVRLSKSLSAFRRTRQEFVGLMNDLSKHIDDAYRAIEGLKNASTHSGQNLQSVLNESKAMASELDILIQSASSHSQRIETGRNRSAMSPRPQPAPDYSTKQEDASFSIFDREYEDAPKDGVSSSAFASQAEKDLYEALQKSRKPARGVQ